MNTLVNREEILSVLYKIDDPEINLNIVDLGLLYQLMINENKITCVMTLTTAFCPMSESILAQVKYTLQQFFPKYNIEVSLTFNPEWTAEMISEKGKQILNIP